MRKYLSAIFVDWWATMSGPVSVIFAVLAAYDVAGQRKLLAALAFASLLVIVWRQAKTIVALKATPNIAGFWVRDDGGTIHLEQDGDRLTGSFPHGGVDHEVRGSYDYKAGKFVIITKRTEAGRQRHTQTEDYWVLRSDKLLFDCARNVDGLREMGILTRKI